MAANSLIQRELNKLEMMPPWGRPQGNEWDRLSRFIYRVKVLEGLRRQAQAQARANHLDLAAFEAYVIRRWYNHHSHQEILGMILGHPSIETEENSRHHSIDFYLRGLPFDLKISRFPHAYAHPISYAKTSPADLVNWLYQHQSQEGRYHTENRFFIILHHDRNSAQTWTLRRHFSQLALLIRDYLDSPTLIGAQFEDKSGQIQRPWAGLIFYTAKD